jgi:hypothetical protein
LSSLESKKTNPIQKKKKQQFGDLSTDITCFSVSTKKKTQPVEDSNSKSQAMIKAIQENAISV